MSEEEDYRNLTPEELETLREETKSIAQQITNSLEMRRQKELEVAASPISLTTIIVHWTGPFSRDDIRKSDRWNGLYLLAGKRKYERQNHIQYCGITSGYFCNRLNGRHHKIREINPDSLTIWLGAVVYPTKFKRSALELAEHCFVHFWQPNLNESKIIKPPDPVCLITQWFNQQGEPRLHRPLIAKGVPDVLWWDEKRWRTGKLSIWPEN